jgi:hypothetical protein
MGGVNIDKGRERSAQEAIGFQGTDVRLGGVGGVQFDPTSGRATGTAEGPNTGIAQLLAQQGQGVLSASNPEQVAALGNQQVQTGASMLDQASSFDPLDAAETRFNRLQSILQKGRARTRDSAESRLLAQGRLGGEGGARQLEGLEGTFQEQDALLLDRQFGEAQQAQRGGIADALAVGGAGTGTQAALADQGLRFSGTAADVNQLGSSNLLSLLQQGGNLGALDTQAEIAKSQAASNLNANLIGKGGGSDVLGTLGTIGGGIAGGIIGIPGGPATIAAGASAGSTIGGSLGGLGG